MSSGGEGECVYLSKKARFIGVAINRLLIFGFVNVLGVKHACGWGPWDGSVVQTRFAIAVKTSGAHRRESGAPVCAF